LRDGERKRKSFVESSTAHQRTGNYLFQEKTGNQNLYAKELVKPKKKRDIDCSSLRPQEERTGVPVDQKGKFGLSLRGGPELERGHEEESPRGMKNFGYKVSKEEPFQLKKKDLGEAQRPKKKT